MAAVTLLGTATFNTNSGTKTVTATPAVGDLIVIVTAHSGYTGVITPTDNASGTYTLINTATKSASADRIQIHVRTALISSAASTIFTHAPGTTTGGGLAVLKVTGMTAVGAAAVVQSAIASNQGASTTPAPVFGSVPNTVNPIIGASFNISGTGMTPRTGYTELVDLTYATPTAGLHVMSRDSGETSATITWGSVSTAHGDIVVELNTSSAPPPPTQGLMMMMN